VHLKLAAQQFSVEAIASPTSSIYNLILDGKTYQIKYQITGSGNKLSSITTRVDKPEILVNIAPQSNGKLTLELPRNVLESKKGGSIADIPYGVLEDGQLKVVNEIKDNNNIQTRTLAIDFNKDNKQIEIDGSKIGTHPIPSPVSSSATPSHNPLSSSPVNINTNTNINKNKVIVSAIPPGKKATTTTTKSPAPTLCGTTLPDAARSIQIVPCKSPVSSTQSSPPLAHVVASNRSNKVDPSKPYFDANFPDKPANEPFCSQPKANANPNGCYDETDNPHPPCTKHHNDPACKEPSSAAAASRLTTIPSTSDTEASPIPGMFFSPTTPDAAVNPSSDNTQTQGIAPSDTNNAPTSSDNTKTTDLNQQVQQSPSANENTRLPDNTSPLSNTNIPPPTLNNNDEPVAHKQQSSGSSNDTGSIDNSGSIANPPITPYSSNPPLAGDNVGGCDPNCVSSPNTDSGGGDSSNNNDGSVDNSGGGSSDTSDDGD
jgi:hypothetical protein